MNGAVLEHVASTENELCRRDSSEATPWRSARLTLSTMTSEELPSSLERLNSVTPFWATEYSGEAGSVPSI